MSQDLPQRPYGTTGQNVSVIGLGGGGLDTRSLDAGVATVRRAMELGVTYFDTSPAYGEGASLRCGRMSGYNLLYRSARRSALPISQQKGVAAAQQGPLPVDLHQQIEQLGLP